MFAFSFLASYYYHIFLTSYRIFSLIKSVVWLLAVSHLRYYIKCIYIIIIIYLTSNSYYHKYLNFRHTIPFCTESYRTVHLMTLYRRLSSCGVSAYYWKGGSVYLCNRLKLMITDQTNENKDTSFSSQLRRNRTLRRPFQALFA